jgi:hypothetical protein
LVIRNLLFQPLSENVHLRRIQLNIELDRRTQSIFQHPDFADTVRSQPYTHQKKDHPPNHQLIDFLSETLRDRTPANPPDPMLLDRAIEPESPKK